jgi:predicted ABC-type ATPase
MTSDKKIVILAGPNGAGKTTFAREFLRRDAEIPIFVNADLIASGLSPFMPEMSTVRAGRIMLEEIRNHVRAGRSLAFETTLSGKLHARSIPLWRRQGYRVKLIYLKIASTDLAISRVKSRVLQGGHAVPEDVVVRRFAAGWRNFERVYKPLVDAWFLFDNSGDAPVVIATEGKAMKPTRVTVADPDLAKGLSALKRAAASAWRLSVETGTPFYVMENGRVVDRNAARKNRVKLLAGLRGRAKWEGDLDTLRRRKPVR